MKKWFYLILAGLLIAAPAAQAAVTNGEPAPDFTLEDTSGKNHSLADFRGKFVVLEWLNHDCPFVRKHYDSKNMQGLQKMYTGEGVVWLSINSSAHGKQGHFHPDEANKLTTKKGARPTAVLMDFDGDVGRTYGAQTTPHMYVINPEGVLIYQGAIDSIPSANVGDIPTSTNFVAQALTEAMAGQAVSTPMTKSYGCSVKY